MVAEKTIQTTENFFSKIETLETETPSQFAEEMLMSSLLPAQVRVLEDIFYSLEEGDWNRAFESGLIGSMGAIGHSLENARSLSPAGQLEEKVSQATTQHRDTVNSIDMAMRIVENRKNYTEEENQAATKVAASEVKNLVLRLKRLEVAEA